MVVNTFKVERVTKITHLVLLDPYRHHIKVDCSDLKLYNLFVLGAGCPLTNYDLLSINLRDNYSSEHGQQGF